MSKNIPTPRIILDLNRIVQLSQQAADLLHNEYWPDVANRVYSIKNHYDDATTGTHHRLRPPHDPPGPMEIEYSPLAPRDLETQLSEISKEASRVIHYIETERPGSAQRLLEGMDYNVRSAMLLVDRYILGIE